MSLTQTWHQNQPNYPSRIEVSTENYLQEDQTTYNFKNSKYDVLNFLPYFFSVSLFREPKRNNRPYYQEYTQKNTKHFWEKTGPFKTHHRWRYIDFKFLSEDHKKHAILERKYIPKNNLILGLDVHEDRIFVTLPKWKKGIPCTLAALPVESETPSPLLVPYPNWNWHNEDDCDALISVFRVQVDSCNRLWLIDSGQLYISATPEQVCRPKIVVFDLNTDALILRYEIPDEFVKQDSLYSNIVVDIRENDCSNAHAYVADVWRFGLIVFSLEKLNSWRITDHLFYPDPLAAHYKIHDLEFEWTDGIFSLALSPENVRTKERLLYFHPMSSFREFYVKTSIICNETGWYHSKGGFKVLGESRGSLGHASAAGMDKKGVLFYNLVSQDSIGCWDSRKPYKRKHLGIVAKNKTTLTFPNDLKIDQEERQSIWIITNRLPYYLYKELNHKDYNFRIMSAYVDEAIHGTVCDPNGAVFQYDSFDFGFPDKNCF